MTYDKVNQAKGSKMNKNKLALHAMYATKIYAKMKLLNT